MSKEEKNVSYEYPNQKIVDIEMEKEVKSSFIQYAMSVIISRALPDVRDGMKPGQRRILYAMYEDNLTHDNPFRKSATTVGNVLGRYHPHGDAAVYGTMVRMAQDFSYRYQLVEGKGNFGSVDGDPPAAYRYTEARLAKLSDEMMRDLEKNVVKMDKNFDNTRDEPSVLPCRFPNFLVNGAVGIAVGMATNVPPHNLGEVIDATVFRMDNPNCSVLELMEYIKGPDFPTRATVYGVNGIIEAYTTGRGKVRVRSKAEINEEKHQIIITEIPYMVNKSVLIEAIANLVKEKKIDGITDVRDESSKHGIRIVFDYRRDANGEIILNQLYKYSQLEDTCSINMLAIVNGEPKVLSLPQVLDNYIAHQESVIKNRTIFELKKARAREHILEGYKIALDNIDEIIEIMKTSSSVSAAKETLSERFGLSDEQAQAIVEMTLGKLTGLERQKVEDELAKLVAHIKDLEDILASEERIKEIIKNDMLEIKRKYADERRTDIVASTNEIVYEDLIEKHTCVITLTKDGYIKRLPSDVYSAQRRGGKGIIGMTTKQEDVVDQVVAVHSHSFLLMFTNKGKIHVKKAYMIPESSRTAKGTAAINVIELEDGEKITALISRDNFEGEGHLTMITRNGIVKRTSISEFAYQRKGGKRAITLDEGDELIYVLDTDETNQIFIATKNGYAVKFPITAVTPTGRNSRGVIGIRPTDGDFVAGVSVVDNNKKLLTITENGFGKRCDFEEFAAHNRGGKGMRCHTVNEKTGRIASIAAVDENDDILLITNTGTVIRTHISEIPVYSRTASGVIVMRHNEDSYVSNFTVVP
ncbi:MAG: DNA gyrase subunit A, partial [Clostridia bacterium]|nr:DNA gyrase subunit A [Clostridia bacterium]